MTRYICPYCANETNDINALCCGEIHSEEANDCENCGIVIRKDDTITCDDGTILCEDCAQQLFNETESEPQEDYNEDDIKGDPQ